MFEAKLRDLMKQINEIVKNPSADSSLPSDAFFLDGGEVVCCERKNGISRFPYSADGLNMWVYSNGVIHAIEGVFNALPPVHHEHGSPINFFAGIPQEDGTYFPVCVMGSYKQLYEPFKVDRYLVYSLSAAYFIADTEWATFAVRADMSREKDMRFSFAAINKKGENLKFVFTSYFEAFLKNGVADDMWGAMRKRAYSFGEGEFILSRVGEYHAMGIKRKLTNAKLGEYHSTTSKPAFLVYQERTIGNAECLRTGRLDPNAKKGGKMLTPLAAEIMHLDVAANEMARVDYVCRISHSAEEGNAVLNFDINPAEIDASVDAFQKEEVERFSTFNIKFGDLKTDVVNKNVLNKFIKTLQKQVDFCAMGKNYVEDRIGIRDVFQQLEQALIWDPKQAREKIIRAISHITLEGRAPRQFSIVTNPSIPPRMDLDAYIDQGNWIISTLYTYLAQTGDYTILDEPAGYFEIVDEKKNQIKFIDFKDSVLDHLLRIADYLDSNIDREDGTNCLRALKGDWNDAIDGLGATTDEGKRFGTGVSVMASLHLYQNFFEMSEILKAIGKYADKSEHYLEVREVLRDGLNKHAVQEKDGEIRLVHGWGDHKSHIVGSFCDSDGLSRISFAPFSFWATSGMVRRDIGKRDAIVNGLHALDSENGIITNFPAFSEASTGVGRMRFTMKGTAENACSYSHATMFATLALYAVGDAEFAWEQLEKTMVIAKAEPTKSPFIMSNSYCVNAEEGIDCISAIDWYTGAGTVMMKNFVRGVLGIIPSLPGITIQTPWYMPCKDLEADILIKGKKVKFIYRDEKLGERRISVDGKVIDCEYDELMRTKRAFIANADIHDGMEIVVAD